ncbi:hypothetical protein SFRURICE_014373, partial [Spodoptera frugiperda]
VHNNNGEVSGHQIIYIIIEIRSDYTLRSTKDSDTPFRYELQGSGAPKLRIDSAYYADGRYGRVSLCSQVWQEATVFVYISSCFDAKQPDDTVFVEFHRKCGSVTRTRLMRAAHRVGSVRTASKDSSPSYQNQTHACGASRSVCASKSHQITTDEAQ